MSTPAYTCYDADRMTLTHTYIRRAALLLAALACLMPARAQRRFLHPELYLGAHAGVMAATTLFAPSVPGTENLLNACTLAPDGGLVFRYNGHKCCGFQVELNYMQRGWAERSDTHAYARRLDYIQLPFLSHIWFGSKHGRGFFNLGPQIGYCVHDDGGNGTKQTARTEQYQPIDHPFDWGVAAGVGGYYRSDHAGVWQVEARFNYSLGTLFSAGTKDYFSNANAMNLSLNLAWLWEFRRP
ncbi:MAG: PorT family protein [Paludibacteraceae bacterium]|nr:PorT family protein [Paludibacteraceae bacterium]